jgi:hypothetical protein
MVLLYGVLSHTELLADACDSELTVTSSGVANSSSIVWNANNLLSNYSIMGGIFFVTLLSENSRTSEVDQRVCESSDLEGKKTCVERALSKYSKYSHPTVIAMTVGSEVTWLSSTDKATIKATLDASYITSFASKGSYAIVYASLATAPLAEKYLKSGQEVKLSAICLDAYLYSTPAPTPSLSDATLKFTGSFRMTANGESLIGCSTGCRAAKIVAQAVTNNTEDTLSGVSAEASFSPLFTFAPSPYRSLSPTSKPTPDFSSYLMAILEPGKCAEDLPYGPKSLKITDSGYFSTNFKNNGDLKWTQYISTTGNLEDYEMIILWSFESYKLQQNRFADAWVGGQRVSYYVTCTKSLCTDTTLVGETWYFSSSSGITTSQFSSSGTSFSAQDGCWGAGSDKVDGGTPGLGVEYGICNLRSTDADCSKLYAGNRTTPRGDYSSLKSWVFVGDFSQEYSVRRLVAEEREERRRLAEFLREEARSDTLQQQREEVFVQAQKTTPAPTPIPALREYEVAVTVSVPFAQSSFQTSEDAWSYSVDAIASAIDNGLVETSIRAAADSADYVLLQNTTVYEGTFTSASYSVYWPTATPTSAPQSASIDTSEAVSFISFFLNASPALRWCLVAGMGLVVLGTISYCLVVMPYRQKVKKPVAHHSRYSGREANRELELGELYSHSPVLSGNHPDYIRKRSIISATSEGHTRQQSQWQAGLSKLSPAQSADGKKDWGAPSISPMHLHKSDPSLAQDKLNALD